MPLQAKTKKGLVKEEMHNFKAGDLHSGQGGPVVKDRKQAIRIALEESRRKGYR